MPEEFASRDPARLARASPITSNQVPRCSVQRAYGVLKVELAHSLQSHG
ncbi:hypothetical protein OG389_00235 [Streptomyces sp. NBC_00435]